jgi:hypothetical protein
MAERKFTRKEYEDYLKWPTWKRDNPEWEDDSEYDNHWANTITSWQQSYKEAYGALVDQWKSAVEYVERMPDTADFDVFAPEIACAKEKIPYAMAAIFQQVSALYGNYPQPQYISPGMDFDKYAQALNQNAQIEYKANGFNALMFSLGMDVAYGGWGVLKTYVDPDKAGPFGKDGKIVIHKMDPAKIAVDPKAKRLKWDDLQFIIAEDEMDEGEARMMFKGAESLITDSLRGTRQPKHDGLYGHHLLSPVATVGEENTSGRNRIKIHECWFKDDRLKFVAHEEIVENEATKVSEDGQIIPNPEYDPDKPQTYDRPEVDEDGKVVGEWVPAYPDGRCIILAGDSVVIQDFENPYWHKQAPFVFFVGAPSRKLFPTGDLTNIVKIDKKMNDIISRIHIMGQCEIERPVITDNKALRPPRSIFKLSGTSTAVLVIQQGSSFVRMPPVEIPQFPWVLLQRYDKAMDLVMANAGVSRGDMAEGSQLSAEAMSSLQGIASGMLKMKAELIAEGIKDLGYQMLWLQRETYDENITIPVALPDGTQEPVEWHEKEAASDYIVDIQSGTGLPGAQQAQSSTAMSYWRERLIDRTKALQMLKMDDWQQICQRMDAKEDADIETIAAGRAQGLYLKEALNPKNQSGSAGRKELA